MININEIARQIKCGEYPRQEVDITQFFHKLNNNEYSPNRDKRIQVRDIDRDIDFVDRVVNKIQVSGDTSGLEDLTCVYFPDENDTKLLNGNHTAEIEVKSNIFKSNACIVNFDTQLGGKMSNAIRLGNLLNKQDVEKVAVKNNDVKKELLQVMKEREQDGLDPKPTDEILDEFAETYPLVSRQTLGQWVSHTSVGGRAKPMRTYTPGELANQRINWENVEDYKDYVVLEPRTLNSWNQTSVAMIFNECEQQNKRNALVIFYCSTVEQVRQLEETDIKKKIKNRYAKLSEYYDLTIKTVFLRYE